jgi:hypothetical protein
MTEDLFAFETGGKDVEDEKEESLKMPSLEEFLKENNKKTEEIPKGARNGGLKIVPYKTNKQQIKQRPLMKQGVIPTHPSSVIFNGRSGSGKSNLVVNLLTRPEFYGRTDRNDEKTHYFDLIFLFSPTAHGGDDLVRYLNLPEKRIFTDFDLNALDKILSTQENLIKQKGLLKAPKILLLLDDIQSDAQFLRSKQIKRIFIQNRHLNVSTWLCGQSFKLTPRSCRLQANNLMFFPGSGSEMQVLCEEFCPPMLGKRDFMELVDYATREQYQFLHINMREQPRTRYRKNLDTILEMK